MSVEIASRIGLLLLFVTVFLCIFNAGTVIACLWTGVKFRNVAIFYGKPLFTIPTPIAPIAIGYIPLGGFVQLDMNEFPSKPLLVRWVVTLGGPVALFLSSVVCLGIPHAGHSFLTLFPQFVELLSPSTRGKPLLGALFNRLQSSPIAAYGVFAAKAAAIQFLPFATMPGGRLLIEATKKRDKSVLAKVLNQVSPFVALIFLICLVIAAVALFRQQ